MDLPSSLREPDFRQEDFHARKPGLLLLSPSKKKVSIRFLFGVASLLAGKPGLFLWTCPAAFESLTFGFQIFTHGNQGCFFSPPQKKRFLFGEASLLAGKPRLFLLSPSKKDGFYSGWHPFWRGNQGCFCGLAQQPSRA